MKQKMDLKEIVLGAILAASLTVGIAGMGYLVQDCNAQTDRDIIYESENMDEKDYEPAIDIPVYLLF